MTLKGAVALAMSVAVHGAALLAIGSAMHEPGDGAALPRRESVPVRVRLIPAQAMHADKATPSTGPVRAMAPDAGASPRRAARRLVAHSEGLRPAPPPADVMAPAIALPPVRAETAAVQSGAAEAITQSPESGMADRGEATQAPSLASAGTMEPTYLNAPGPAYPPAAREDGQEGLVILRVRISADGLPLDIALRRSSGSRVLDRAAIAAVRRWTFVPARRGSHPIESWINVPIRFRLEG